MMKMIHAVIAAGAVILATSAGIILFHDTPASTSSTSPEMPKAKPKSIKWAPDFIHAGSFSDKKIDESSGLATSSRIPNLLWSHNDSGNAPTLFASDLNGKSIGRVPVAVPNEDWEEILIDKDDLYIADTGNNKDNRDFLQVYRLKEPDPKTTQPVKVDKIWQLRCPGNFESESLIIFKDHGYLLDKNKSGKPARIYRFPLAADQAVDLENRGTIDIPSPITAASLSPDKRHLAILSTDGLRVFPMLDSLETSLSQSPQYFPIDRKQIEGCAFTPDGILVSAETGQLILLPNDAFKH